MPRGGARPGAGRPRKNPEPAAKAPAKPRAKKEAAPVVDAEGFKTDAAPPNWPFGKEPEQPPEDLTELTPLDYLLEVMRDSTNDVRTRVQAAQLAAPYVHAKKGEVGKKEQRQEAAQKVGGRFAPSAPPKLVAAGGKKV